MRRALVVLTAPIATALATGQVDVGATGLTAALYDIVLGGEKLWNVADKGREWPGYPLTAIVVQKELWDGGLRTVRELKGKRIGVTQLGSTFHYHIGTILEKEGLGLADVKIVPLQAMGAVMEALKGRQVDAILLPQPFPGTAEAQGFGRIQPGRNYDEVVDITSKATGARPEVIRLGFPHQDRNGRRLVPDIETQMAWWVKHGFMKTPVPLREIVDTSFVESAVRALPE